MSTPEEASAAPPARPLPPQHYPNQSLIPRTIAAKDAADAQPAPAAKAFFPPPPRFAPGGPPQPPLQRPWQARQFVDGWLCHKCGKENLPGKSRCGSCQAWRGGKREGYGKKRKAASPFSVPRESWRCPCGIENDARKVRCRECQKWRGGKRTPKGAGALPWRAPRPPPPPPPPLPLDAAPEAPGVPWTCDKCGEDNGASKVRCAACPRWKGGKRPAYGQRARARAEDEMRRTLAGEATGKAPPTLEQVRRYEAAMAGGANWICKGCNHVNTWKKSRCGSCQRWKFGKRENMLKKNRCATIEKPSNQGPLAAGGNAVAASLPGTSVFPQPAPTTNPATAAMPNQPNMPWKCTRCGDDNGCKKLRCRTCQSWKNGKRQLTQRDDAAGVVANSGPANATAVAQQRVDGALHAPPWDCHRCKARVLGTKNRCPNCKSWKGGVRPNFGKNKLVPEPWKCHRCGKENDGKRVRCTACQCWRGGARPDVAARRAHENTSNGNTWTCDKCQRANKVSKVRCGGCQRWRGGQRPGMRKGANASWAHQLPPGTKDHIPRIAPVRATHLPLMPIAVNQPHVPPPASVPRQTTNTQDAAADAVFPHQDNVIGIDATQQNAAREPSQSGAPGVAPAVLMTTDASTKTEMGAWTCAKCTCYNLATEMQCKICDCVRDGWTKSTISARQWRDGESL